jgi:hypothetical protein
MNKRSSQLKESNQIEKSIQMKYHFFLNGVASCFSKAEIRFLREMFFGVLCSIHVHVSKIDNHIQDRISLKKTLKRLSYHLHKIDLWIRLQRASLQKLKVKLVNSSSLIMDLEVLRNNMPANWKGCILFMMVA